MNPEVAALLETLASDPRQASVTFFPIGLHTHLMSDGMGGWNLQVHTSVQSYEEEEVIISDEEHLTTDELVGRMSMLALMSEGFISQQAEAAMSGLDAELDALLNGE